MFSCSPIRLPIVIVTTILLSFGINNSGASTDEGTAKDTKDPYHCVRKPRFIQKVGMQEPVAIDTKQSRLPGVVVRELSGSKRGFRHPTWEQSGHVASTIRDSKGNIYVIPFPSISLGVNPLEKRNMVYRIDSLSGEMAPFLSLPLNGEHSQQNPFGTMAINYDCENNSLYISSVANSTSSDVNGVIYQVNVETKKIESRFNNVDAMGVGIFDTGDGKRLYYGEARSSSVYSLPLGDNGQILSLKQPRFEFSLLNIKNGDSTQVRKINFVKDRQYGYKLVATETEFSYRLLVESGRRFRDYEFAWDPSKNKWDFIKMK